MEVDGRPTFGGMEKAFSTNIMMLIVEFFAGRLRIFRTGWKAPRISKQGIKRKLTCRRSDIRFWGVWDTLPTELLFSVLMKLSVIDYLAFSGVCRSWRSTAIDFRKCYMERQQPLVVVRPKYTEKACVMYNMFDGKSYKTMLLDLACKNLIGLSCGYLITIDRNIGFWLLNLITRHELHFPVLPEHMGGIYDFDISAVLFRSIRLSRVYMVLFSMNTNFLLLSESGASYWQEYHLPITSAGISDVKIFESKIFVLTCDALFGEFNPMTDPVLKLYRINIPIQLSSHVCLRLVTSDNKLYTIISHHSPLLFTLDQYLFFCELDHKKMEFVKQVHDLGRESLFLSRFNSAVVDTTGWGAGNCVCLLQPVLFNCCSFFHLDGNRLATIPVVWDSHSKPYFWYFPSESWDISCVGDEFDT